MKIGVAREIKSDEYRVALTPAGARELGQHGHEVLVETGAGEGSSFPDDAYPGPNLDWLHELVRFFDRYLKGVENGWEAEPALVWFERAYAEPEAFPASWPGRWRAAAAFPIPGVAPVPLVLDRDPGGGMGRLRFGLGAPADEVDALPHKATVGTRGALSWGAGSSPNGLARDLRADEAHGLVYTGEPLADLPLLSPGPLTAEQAWLLLMLVLGEERDPDSARRRFREEVSR